MKNLSITLSFIPLIKRGVTATKITGVKSPSWVRALQIAIGAIAIVLSLAAIIYPVITIVTVFTVAAIVLLLIGIESVIAGIFLYKQARGAHIGLGILVIVLSIFMMAFPLSSAVFAIILGAVALMFSGFASIVAGLMGRNELTGDINMPRPSKGARTLSVIAGALAVALSIMILASPAFGIALAAVVIGVGLLVYGIRLVVTGITGRGQAWMPSLSSS
ncbi:hypothetical protein NTE_03077 [Candidatus Nitrososphaera evergladensis SR1]|jgi:uncharacterized membrane protein HdeD (DUF308 family)|uniref:DUF308 domain-containing protein n=1 Tax=Candidatus Nitrososphaera evergladensis SR1 TaxID=1459636 RepID=A0A075MTX8_9ARCH|nr:DUF308 domain-containing protein [Candidatus Nitrososphaera evergladensis]AIF85111.1 hypothetical protein NTE_03077 [Candidatus Nitrososphaera evergladensis SR1]